MEADNLGESQQTVSLNDPQNVNTFVMPKSQMLAVSQTVVTPDAEGLLLDPQD